MNSPIYLIIGLQQRDRQDPQNLKNDAFYRFPVTSAQSNVGSEKQADDGILLDYDDGDDYSQGYGQINEVFRDLTEDDIPKPYIPPDKFRSSKVSLDDVGYNLYVFDMRYQQSFIASQPFEVECNLMKSFSMM